MVKKSVIWTETALKQRREILKYWTARNGSTKYAERLIKITKEKTALILQNPYIGKPTNHFETRTTAMGNFSIYYRIIEENIFITAFWDNRQDPGKLLEILKK